MHPLLREINKSIADFGAIRARHKTKLTGAVTIELLRRYLEAKGLTVSGRDVFVRGYPAEVDLVVTRQRVIPDSGRMGDPAVYVALGGGPAGRRAGLEVQVPYWAGLLPPRAGRGRRAKIAVAHKEDRAPLARGGPTDPARLRRRRGVPRADYAV